MATKNLVNVFVRVFVKGEDKGGNEFWKQKRSMATRIPDCFEVPIISAAIQALADRTYVTLDFVPGEGNLDAIIDEAYKAKKATRSPITEAGLEALIHKLNALRLYADKAGARNINLELVAYPRS